MYTLFKRTGDQAELIGEVERFEVAEQIAQRLSLDTGIEFVNIRAYALRMAWCYADGQLVKEVVL